MSIKLDNIKVYFSGVKALDGVSIVFRPGEVHGLIGENGAGKSTTMGVLSGSLKPTSGHVSIDGREVSFTRPADAVRHGVALVSQEGTLVTHMSAADNICLGFEPTHLGGFIKGKEALRSAEQLLKKWFPSSHINLRLPVAELPYASQKIVEILRALNANPTILILDEPTATLPAVEKAQLLTLIKSLASKGVGIILISHFMSEILEVSEQITALQDGRVVFTGERTGLDERALIGFMMNRSGVSNNFDAPLERESRQLVEGIPRQVLCVQQWQGDKFNVPEFSLASGEVVGLIGLTGSGHAEFAMSLFEPTKSRRGKIEVEGKDCSNRSISYMKSAGVALVPDHRMINALLGSWSIKQNLSLINISTVSGSPLRLISSRNEAKQAHAVASDIKVKMSSVDQLISQLSGGNKQKVSIGRWLFNVEKQASVFIFIEPTEGVDIGSKREIHRLMRKLSKAGAAVVVVSSDLLEVMTVADRVIPFRNGTLGSSIPFEAFNEQLFIDSIAGVQA